MKPTIISLQDTALGSLDLRHVINLLVIGPTGTGKTVTIKIILGKIAHIQNLAKTGNNMPVIWILDYKMLDFRNLEGISRYYGFTDCLQGLNDYYAAFKSQQKFGVKGPPNYIVIDEWGSFIMSLEAKEAKQAQARLAELIMLGRGYNFFPIVGIQRPDSSYFQSARDNFQNVIALGNLSPEGRRMVFPDSVREQITECKKREGHLYIDGMGLEKIQIEEIADMDALDTTIREAMNC